MFYRVGYVWYRVFDIVGPCFYRVGMYGIGYSYTVRHYFRSVLWCMKRYDDSCNHHLKWWCMRVRMCHVSLSDLSFKTLPQRVLKERLRPKDERCFHSATKIISWRDMSTELMVFHSVTETKNGLFGPNRRICRVRGSLIASGKSC